MLLYRLLNFVLFPLTMGYVIWKTIKHKQLRYLQQRCGLGLSAIPKNAIWIHCASVGEVNTVLPLVYELHKRHSEQNFLITTNTPTGAEIVLNQQQAWLFHAYLPFDWLFAIKLFIASTQPRACYILETELWPNLFSLVNHAGIPLTIINGRLSAKTLKTYAWIRRVLGKLLQMTNHIYARTEDDRAGFIQLGADAGKVTVIGNLKYAPPVISDSSAKILSRAYVVVASTHHDEEIQIAQNWLALDRGELLVIAPRHPERRDEIIHALKQLTGGIAVRSRHDEITRDTKIYLLDTVGELTNWFENAMFIIMGGSFVPVGGHNLLEPAHFGKVVICGPSMHNFKEEIELMLHNGAAIQVSNLDELRGSIQRLLVDADALQKIEANVRTTAAHFSNIIDQYADIVDSVVNT